MQIIISLSLQQQKKPLKKLVKVSGRRVKKFLLPCEMAWTDKKKKKEEEKKPGKIGTGGRKKKKNVDGLFSPLEDEFAQESPRTSSCMAGF